MRTGTVAFSERLLVPRDGDIDRFFTFVSQRTRDVGAARHVLTIHRGDDIAGLDPCLGRRRISRHRAHEHALLHAEIAGQLIGQRRQGDAERRAIHRRNAPDNVSIEVEVFELAGRPPLQILQPAARFLRQR